MALSGAECSMAVIAAFPLSLVVVLSSVPFPINIDILGFSQNCSCTALALSFKGTSDMPRIILGYVSGLLGLLSYVLGYTPPRLGPWAPM